MEIEVQTAHRRHDDEHEGSEHAGGLERVRPHEGLHSGTARVEPDEQYHHHYRTRKRHMPGIEHEMLEDEANHIEPHRCANEFGDNEERRTGLVAASAEALAQITVYGGEVQLVIYGQEDKCHGEIARDEAQAHLQVGHIALEHHAGHGNEGYAGDGRTHHAKGHHRPRTLPVAAEESLVACVTRRDAAYGENHQEIYYESEKHDVWYFVYLIEVQQATPQS